MASDTDMPTPAYEFISLAGFKAVIWLSFGLMVTAFTIRAYIRIACFRRLFTEDWLMLLALTIFLISAIITTLFLHNVYNLGHLADGTFIPGPTFDMDTLQALRAFAGVSILIYIGLWIIKINFLVFFYRLGHQLPKFRIFWWIVLFVVIATGAAQIGIIKFNCLVTDNILTTTSSTDCSLEDTKWRFAVSVALDILTDVLLIAFPVSLLWTSRISLRQKLALSGIFSLVGITIAVTVVRGGFSVNIDDPSAASELNISYDFFVTLEYLVSFLVACAISFRSLFTQRRNKVIDEAELRARRYHEPTQNRGRDSGRSGNKKRGLYDTILDTCKVLEGADFEDEKRGRPTPLSGFGIPESAENERTGDWDGISDATRVIRTQTHSSLQTTCDDSVRSLEFTHAATAIR